MGTISAEDLPSRELWPTRMDALPALQTPPQKLNSTEELLDKAVAAGPSGLPPSWRTAR